MESGSLDMLTSLGRAQHALLHGEVSVALEEFKQLVEAAPENMYLQERFANVLVEVGEIEASRLTLRMVARHWESLGFQLRAVKVWRKLVELSPMDLNAKRHLGELYVSLHLFDLAKQAYLQLAETFAVQGNFRRRVAMLEAILRFDSQDLDVRILLLRELTQLGMEDAAIGQLREICDLLYARKDWPRLVPHLKRLADYEAPSAERRSQLAEAEYEWHQATIAESTARRAKAITGEAPRVQQLTSDSPVVGETTARRLEKGEIPASFLEAFEGGIEGLFTAVDDEVRLQGHDAKLSIGFNELTGEGGHSIIRRLAELEAPVLSPLHDEQDITHDQVLSSVDGVICVARAQSVSDLPPLGMSSAFGRRPFGPSSEVLLREPGHVVAAAIRARHRGDAVLALALLEDEAARSWPEAVAYEKAMSLLTRQLWQDGLDTLRHLWAHGDLARGDQGLVAYHIGLVCEVIGDVEQGITAFESAMELCADEASEIRGRILRLKG